MYLLREFHIQKFLLNQLMHQDVPFQLLAISISQLHQFPNLLNQVFHLIIKLHQFSYPIIIVQFYRVLLSPNLLHFFPNRCMLCSNLKGRTFPLKKSKQLYCRLKHYDSLLLPHNRCLELQLCFKVCKFHITFHELLLFYLIREHL